MSTIKIDRHRERKPRAQLASNAMPITWINPVLAMMFFIVWALAGRILVNRR